MKVDDLATDRLRSILMARAISITPSALQTIRHATRLLSMVHELHKAGYQRIRVCAGMSPSGMHWRCLITHADNLAEDKLMLRDWKREVAHYTSADGDRYFAWSDAPGRSARELAVRFVERFSEIAALGDGRDWAYAGWLTEILGRAELGGIDAMPIFFADYPLKLDPHWLPPPP